MKYPIVTAPDPILRQTCRKLDYDKEQSFIQQLAKDLTSNMRTYDGIGLSAPQLGHNVNMLVAEFKTDEIDPEEPPFPLHILINPVITKKSLRKISYLEGCLSLPNLEIEIERPEEITVEYLDISGKKQVLTANKLLARVIQHETDHLHGILFTDYIETRAQNAQFEGLNNLKIAFISSSDIADDFLINLAQTALRPAMIITESEKPSGRGYKIQPNPISQLGQKLNIPVLETDSAQMSEKIFAKYKFDSAIIFAFGQILSQNTLDLVKYGIYNIHPSLLPQLRGATPIPSAILQGLTKTGISLMKINSEMDQGDLTYQSTIDIKPVWDCRNLWRACKDSVAKEIPDAYAKSLLGLITQTPQVGQPTYCYKFSSVDRLLSSDMEPQKFVQTVNAFSCAKKAYAIIDGKRINFIKATIEGTKIKLLEVQLEGKKISSPKSLDQKTKQALQNFHKMIIL